MKRRMPKAELEDLEQAGMVGLIDASTRYCGESLASFKTFVFHRIRGAMLDSLREGDWTPRSVTKAAREISNAIRAIENKEQRPAREGEIADLLGLSVEAYRKLLTETSCRHVFSFSEAPQAVDVASAYPPPDKTVEESRLAEALWAAIASINERERFVVEQTFLGDATLADVGKTLGVNESRVCQIRNEAIAKLRKRLMDFS